MHTSCVVEVCVYGAALLCARCVLSSLLTLNMRFSLS